MDLVFEKNCYFSTITSNARIHEVKDIAKNNLLYKYGNGTYTIFCNKFKSFFTLSDRIYRLVKSLPGAVWAVAQLIYHIASIIFIGLPKAVIKQNLHLEINFYFVLRDLEELSGRILSIFNDRYGAYLIEESQFQKKCYEYFLSNYYLQIAHKKRTSRLKKASTPS